MSSPSKESLNTYVVTQSNKLIEMDYSNSKLSANAMKIAKLIVAKLSPDDEEMRFIRIKNSTIKQYLGYKKGGTYNRFLKDMKAIKKRLNEHSIDIVKPDGSLLDATFISTAEFFPDEIEFEISIKLKPYLLQLRNNYTSYQLRNIPKLNSTYSIRFYELLSQYRRIGKRQFEVEDLKRKVGCNYSAYGHFKNKALLLAQDHLAEVTDLRFEFEEIKTGRKVTSLIFYIYPNDPDSDQPQRVLPFLEEEFSKDQVHAFTDTVAATFQSLGISEDTLKDMLATGFSIIEDEQKRQSAITRCRTVDQYFVEKLTLLQQSKSTKNPAGFFIKAVKEDWTIPTLFQKKQTKIHENSKSSELSALEKEIDARTASYESRKQEIAAAYFRAHQEVLVPLLKEIGEQYSIMRKQIKPYLSDPFNYQENRSVAALVNTKLEQNEPALFLDLKPLKANVESLRQKLAALKR